VISKFTWEIPVSFPLYIVAFMAFLGWFFFTLFVGVGFIALPLDLLNEFRTRPEPMTTKTYFDERALLGGRTKTLLEIANKLSLEMEKKHTGAKKRQETRDMRNLEKHYFYLKKDFQILTIAYKLRGGNPLEYFFKLVGGIIFGGISLSWWIHIAIYILPAKPVHPFLNNFFVALTENVPSFPLFGVLAFALWSFHLLFCVVKGNFRLGVRFLVFKLYPMEVGNTLMNAFLFNTWIILLTSIPAVQFCVEAFPIYTSDTQASVMFGTQVRGTNASTRTRGARGTASHMCTRMIVLTSLCLCPSRLVLVWFRSSIWISIVTSF
jgi:LMBR1 domain-containing protein 1